MLIKYLKNYLQYAYDIAFCNIIVSSITGTLFFKRKRDEGIIMQRINVGMNFESCGKKIRKANATSHCPLVWNAFLYLKLIPTKSQNFHG